MGRSERVYMLTASSPKADGSVDSRDPVIQQTPVAGQSFSKDDLPRPPTIGTDINRSEPNEYKGTTTKSQLTEEGTPHTPLPEDASGEASLDWELQTIGNDSVNNELHEHGIRYNKRTPNLDRIAKFFKGNRTPGENNVMLKFDVSEDGDTPLSKRDDGSSTSHECEKAGFGNVFDRKELGGTESIGGGEAFEQECNGDSSGGPMIATDDTPVAVDKTPNDREPSFGHPEARFPFLKLDRLRSEDAERRMTMSDGSQVNGLKEMDDVPNKPELENGRKIAGLSDVKSNSNALQNGVATPQQEDKSMDCSHIDDTTEGIPEMWVLRPNNSDAYNSNKSTQIINTTDTQIYTKETPARANEGDDIIYIREQNEVPTQVIASQNDTVLQNKETKAEMMGRGVAFSTQIIQSPEERLSNSLETPRVFPKINFEPLMEVPETSSPSKSREVGLDNNSSPSPAQWDRGRRIGNATQIDNSEDIVRLQISSKPDSLSPQEQFSQTNVVNARTDTVVVLSDAELTQELPEIEEDAAQGNLGLDDETHQMQRDENGPTGTRKRREAETVELIAEEEHRSSKASPSKKACLGSQLGRDNSQCTLETNERDLLIDHGQTTTPGKSPEKFDDEDDQIRPKLPSGVKNSDEECLSKSDIIFEDAVWCQYSLDYRYYPGRILYYEEQLQSYWVYFETGKSLTKSEDIYYLDIRVGDVVILAGKKYQVVGLESRESNEATIRCIRGYDTVHLKKAKKSGSLVQKTIVKPLASVCLDLTEWTKRPKVILENGFQSKAKAYQALQRPIRGRKNNATSSPRKVKSTALREQATRPVYKEESDEETNYVEERKPDNEHNFLDLVPNSLHISDAEINKHCQIFKDCVFVLTGLNEDRQQLRDVIQSQGGDILELGFSELFDYELLKEGGAKGTLYQLQLQWKKKILEKKYRFACLITRRHLRSLKYLETLALNWPTLHWKFIRTCLQRGRLYLESIHRYLLPSGESYRLSFEPSTKNGVIKSNNIYQFYWKISQGFLLEAQVHAMREEMKDYMVILYGESELDHFVRFAFTCLGVVRLYHMHVKTGATLQEEARQINHELGFLLQENDESKVLIYVNKSNGISSALLEDLREQIYLKCQSEPASRFEFHVEAKEWLIQSIINGATGFDD